MKIITNEMLNCEPEVYEALENNPLGQNPSLTPSNLKTKGIYEREHFDALAVKFERSRGFKNWAWFAKVWGDVDLGYSSYCNE